MASFAEAEGLSPWDRVKASAATMRDRVESRVRAGTPQKMEGSGRALVLEAGSVLDEAFDRWARSGDQATALDLEIEVLDEGGARTAAHTVFDATVVRYEAGPWAPETGSSVQKLELSCAGWDWSSGAPPDAPSTSRASCRRAALVGGLVGGGTVALIAVLILMLVGPRGDVPSEPAGGIAVDEPAVTPSKAGVKKPPRESLWAVLHASPAAGDAPLQVAFDGSGSGATGGRVASFQLEFGDGASEVSAGRPGVIEHTYAEPGMFTARLVVTSETGTTADDAVTVAVSKPPPPNAPPVAVLKADPEQGDVPLDVTFSTKGTGDPDGAIASWDLSFDDKTSTQGKGAPPSSIGHTYDGPGTFTAVLTVVDDRGAKATAFVQVFVG